VDKSNTQYDSVKLYETDKNGENATFIADLYDNGSIDNADEILGDSVYSGIVDLMSQKKAIGEYYYRVFLDAGTTKGSSMVLFDVIPHIDVNEYTKTMEQTNSVISGIVLDFDGELSAEQFENYKQEILDTFIGDSYVKTAKQYEGGLSVEYESGITLHVAPISDNGFRGVTAVRKQDAIQHNDGPKVVLNSKRVSNKRLAGVAESEQKSIVPMQTIMALSPYYDELNANGGDDFDGAFDVLKNSTSPLFTVNGEFKNKEVLPSHFKNLNENGIVVITSHGDVIDGVPVIILSVRLSDMESSEAWNKINKDISTGLIKLRLSSDGEYNLCITPEYISKYNNKGRGNSIVYLGICSGLTNSKLADAFLNSGFAAVVGYDSKVSNAIAFNSAQKLFAEMVSGKSLKEAFDVLVAETFNVSSTRSAASSPITCQVNVSGQDIILVSIDALSNANFEKGLQNWSYKGDVRIAKTFANFLLTDGGNMLILGTGIANGVQLTDSKVWQSFTMPNDAEYLDFAYDFASEEPMEWIGTEYNDTFETTLIGGGHELRWKVDVNSSEWYPLNGDVFPLGDKTGFHTGIGGVSPLFVIPQGMRGKVVTLTFHVWDVGDSFYDSAALIGDIRVWKKDEIPTPGNNNDSPPLTPCKFTYAFFDKAQSEWPWPYNLSDIGGAVPDKYKGNVYEGKSDNLWHMNCVFFARARAMEANGLSTYDKTWNSIGPNGQGNTIRANSIARFSGHEVFIERLERDTNGNVTNVWFTEANWHGNYDGEIKVRTWDVFTKRPGGGNISYIYF
jgi:hypothetical protein